MRNEPIKVLFFSPTLGAGGAEMQVLRLLKGLDRTTVSPLLSVARGGGEFERWLPADVTAHVCTTRVKSSLLSVGSAVLPLRRHIQRERPDVVIALLEHASVALGAALTFMQPRPKLVLGIQNNFSMSAGNLPPALRAALVPLYLRAYGQADHVIAISRGVAEDLACHLPSAAGKTTVVYNAGKDEQLDQLVQAPLEEARPSGPLIVACGRLNTQKDFGTLIRALPLLTKRPAPELWVLGEGPLKDELVKIAADVGVSSRIRWLGFRPNPYPFLAAADAFVLSSRWEGFANVIVESLACGTPVVATDCPYGPREILADGLHGKLVPVGDSGAIAAALDQTLAEGKDAALSARCRARAQSFDAQTSASGYAEVFRRVTAQP